MKFIFGKKPHVDTDPNKIEEILTRGVEDVFVKDSLRKRLLSGEQLRIKFGVDPTSSKIHIGRASVIRKLQKFQALGHKIVFLIGDFTAQIGDPSDKLEKRPMLSKEKIQENLKTYKAQVGTLIDLSKAEFHYNSTWLGKLGFGEVCQLAESFSVQQMSNRRNFKERFDKGEEVSLREFMYPLMQGYDSVQMKADVEIGGFDQLFNVKAGRVIQKHYGMKEQDVLTTAMLTGTDGRKMSSSWGNVIAITDEPSDMYGKVMSVKDELIVEYFIIATDVDMKEIEEIKSKLSSGENPRDIKMQLAREIVTLHHSKESADKAEQDFINTFSKGGIPEDVEEIKASEGEKFVDVLVRAKVLESKGEWRRLVLAGAVSNAETEEKITSPDETVKNTVLKVGKRRFAKIVVQ